jgi:hypothetical protein
VTCALAICYDLYDSEPTPPPAAPRPAPATEPATEQRELYLLMAPEATIDGSEKTAMFTAGTAAVVNNLRALLGDTLMWVRADDVCPEEPLPAPPADSRFGRIESAAPVALFACAAQAMYGREWEAKLAGPEHAPIVAWIAPFDSAALGSALGRPRAGLAYAVAYDALSGRHYIARPGTRGEVEDEVLTSIFEEAIERLPAPASERAAA